MGGLLSAVLCTATALGAPPRGEITYVHATQVYVDLGEADGLAPGAQLSVRRKRRVIGKLVVLSCAAHSATARVEQADERLRPGDQVAALDPLRPKAGESGNALRAPTTTSAVWQAGAEAKVPLVTFAEDRSAPALRQVSARAHLLSSVWLAQTDGTSSLFQQDQLALGLRGPVDSAQRFWVDAELSVIGAPLRPETVRFNADRQVWLEVYRALVAYRRQAGLGLALGRMSTAHLRYGLLDGGNLSYQVLDGPTVELGAGLRPQTVSLMPALEHPVVLAAVSGQQPVAEGFFSYAASGSWLGLSGGASEGAEAGLELGLARGDLWLDAEAGGLVLLPQSGATRFVLDRAQLAGSLGLGEEGRVWLSLRRWQDVMLPSELELLPDGYASEEAVYDVTAQAAGHLWTVGPFVLEGDVRGGGALTARGGDERYWFSPGVSLLVARLMRLRLRLGYRLELGWLAGQRGEVGVGIEPYPRLRVDLGGDGGALYLRDTGVLLFNGSAWLRMSWRLGHGVSLVAHGRSLFGDAGQGFQATLSLSAYEVF